ncbi:mediator of RNA polymerase II transcription subunit 13-like [Watersipora subatra]|uniref:mediator of RNA polymerase II transcription subunit 13-like n=1 Tax=Watersipora subatra TaxID=2589382 RepID=UPI00355C7FA4
MASQGLSGNGSRLSLENCLTNIFALTDLAGIRWKRLRSQVGCNMEVLDDPVLSSYAKCLKAEMLCSWARVPITDETPPPNNFMGYAKELWVFWYGDEPTNLQTYLSTELQETEQGNWETTLLSYECRTFLFKALHNVIERCLLAKQFVRIGKWFVQPQGEGDADIKRSPLSFSFQNFFLHGESTVCVSVDVERRPQLYRLTSQELRCAKEGHSSNLGSVPSTRLSSVILAPYGLAGVLTGRLVSPSDQSLADWQQFYPIANPPPPDDELPAMVEVAVGGVLMKYPSGFVVTTRAPLTSERKVRQTDKVERCANSLLARTSLDRLQIGKRDEESNCSAFAEVPGRTSCTCVKSKSCKQKQRFGSPASPKLDGKRQRVSFHRRTPPIDKPLASLQSLKTAGVSQSASGSLPTQTVDMPCNVSSERRISANTPQLSLKETLSSPASFPQPSPLRTPKTPSSNLMSEKLSNSRPPSVRAVGSVEEQARSVPQSHQPPFSVGSSRQPQTPGQSSSQVSSSQSDGPTTMTPAADYVSSQLENMQTVEVGTLELGKRPSLPLSPVDDDELRTDSLYSFSTLNAWLELPLKKKFKPEVGGNVKSEVNVKPDEYVKLENDVKPEAYEYLDHPLANTKVKIKAEQSVTATYFLSTNKSDPGASPVLLVKPEIAEANEPVMSGLMTSDDLKPHLSDLDNIFEFDDEGVKERMGATAGNNSSLSQPTAASSGGKSMASAHAVGPVSAADLCMIYPTPPSHDNHNTALSPTDHLHVSHQDTSDNVDIPEPTAAIYRTANMAKYLSVSEYQPLDLPSTVETLSLPPECSYNPWAKPSSLVPVVPAENLPSTLAQPSSVNSSTSPVFYPPGRTPLGSGPHDILQSPGSVLSLPPKSVAGLSSVENPSTHGVASTFNAQSLPEAQALLVNMTLSDSMLNLYKDQNFESCNLCVCNMNILGNDLGLYLPREKYEAQYKCSCGFSAVSNRHYGYCSGLFYDDECDIMNHRDDRFDKLRLKPLAGKGLHEVNRILLQSLQEQFLPSSPSLLTRYTNFSNAVVSNSEKKVEFERQDVCAVIMAALNTGQYIQDAMSLNRHQSQSQCWSRWSLERAAKDPVPSLDIIQLLRSLQPALQDAVQKKRTTSLWDPNAIKVTGPMTWSAFFKLAGRSTDELLEPQPIPVFLVGHEDDWLRQSPFALQYWDKLLLKPYGGERNISYVVVAPDNELINKCSKKFFHELSLVYGQCLLGRHMPYQGQKDGLLSVGRSHAAAFADKPISDWFHKIDSLPIAQQVRLLAKVCKHQLAPLLSNKSPDITSPLPAASQSGGHEFTKPSQPASSTSAASVFGSPTREEPNIKDILTDTRYKDCRPKTRDNTCTSVVIYLVNPFATGVRGCGDKEGSSAESDEAASTLALIMCFHELLENLPDKLRRRCYLEIVPLHSVLAATRESPDQQVLRSMAFSVYSKVARKQKPNYLGPTMTGFGPAADLSGLSGDEVPPIHTPPYVLAPKRNPLFSDAHGLEDKSRVLFCAYCLSEDQRWLLASVVRDNGEQLDTTVINVHVPNHSRRKKASVIKHGIQRLFKYLETTMSKSLTKWRLVIGRFGRLGHGELKEWSKLLNKRSLLRTSMRIRDSCGLCSSIPNDKQMGILGACLISIEPHASFSVLYTEPSSKDDKKSTSCPLSTPQDASVTHILVIPNSTTAGGNPSQTEAQIFSGDIQNDSENLLTSIDLVEDLDLGDIFGMDFGADPLAGSPPHSPTNASSMFGAAGGLTSRRGTVTSMMDVPAEDQVNLLQQPLAMGYIVSTAPTGRLPSWFYSTAPQTEGACPVVLKSALHFHMVCSQQNQDDYNHMTSSSNQQSNTHPLDSGMTCDVLRYVLDSYNRLSWLTVDPVTNDRISCLPVHIDALMKLYNALNTFL